MKEPRISNWIFIFCNPITIAVVWFGVMVFIAITPPKVSEWKEVTVVSRNELTVSCGFCSETEVSLVFSDGTTWKGYPSSAKTNEQHLLYAQKGDVEFYRFNSHYLSGKQWR